MRIFSWITFIPLLVITQMASAQVTFWSDQFNGGLLTGGFEVGTVGQGSGSFNMPLPAGCTIHQAYFFGTQVGAAADITVDMNGTPYTFDAGNLAGPLFNTGYGGLSGVHAIDVTADINATITNYTITVPFQSSQISNTWTEFYLVIGYELVGATSVNVELYFNDQDAGASNFFVLNTAAPLLTANGIGFATLGGYASAGTDCESITVNGTLLGSFWGGDFNSADLTWGTMGCMAYANGAVTGLGDDNADQAINNTDVVSDINGLVINGSNSVNVQYDHCSGGGDNHIWLMVLAYSSDACTITADLGPDAALCTGDALLLDVTQTNATYAWQDGSTGPTFNVTTSGDYWVTVTSVDCNATDTLHVDVSAPPVFDLGADMTICAGTSLVLDATSVPVGNVTWQDNSNSATQTVSLAGTYWAEVDNNGCVRIDSIVVAVSPAPLINLPAQEDLCIGESVILDAGNVGSSHLWSTGAQTQSISVSTTATYEVTVTNAFGCSTEDSTQVFVHLLPVVQLGPDTSLCEGEIWSLDAGILGGTYIWSTGATGQSINVNTEDTYWVEMADAFGCAGSDTILITYDPVPVVQLNDAEVCISETVVLDAGNPGATFLWNTGETTQALVLDSVGGTFSVVVTNAGWCSGSGSATVAFVEFPVVDIGEDAELCDLDTLLLDAGNAGSMFTWNTGASTQQISVTTGTNIWVDVDNGFCTTRDSLFVTFHPLPEPLEEEEVVGCFNYPPYKTRLDAGNNGCTYAWSTDEENRTIDVNSYGWYSVTITTLFGCSLTDSINVLEYCPPQLFIPNTFTPNGDGINDFFGPSGHLLADVELSIFDRWGQPVWSGVDGGALWDGTISGTPAKSEVYIWELRYRFVEDVRGTLGEYKQAVGHVTVLR
ncbi:MAG: gliding motility-associated C-terminal domain-containing protein [Flavobacteriales bacterium]|nr:gliding motility-associated C-terminal domain-containing protein [Flavobacteriales bacterium]